MIRPTKLVVLETPFAGKSKDPIEWQEEVDYNLSYLRAAMRDCFMKGEAPYASHALYTQPGVLNDKDVLERERGMEGGFMWGVKADYIVVYYDLGLSSGMREGITRASQRGQEVHFRSLPGWVPFKEWKNGSGQTKSS
jgi:hypothetical protein